MTQPETLPTRRPGISSGRRTSAAVPRAVGTIGKLAGALLTPHGVDRYLELVDPMLVRGQTRARVTAVHAQTENAVTLTLKPSRGWRPFQAGQYVRLAVDIDGVRRTRCYSPASSQHRTDGQFELTIHHDRAGLVSPHLNDAIRSGEVFGLSQPDGTFTIPDPRPPSILLISAGSGITPVLSMLRTLIDEGYSGRVCFLHYSRSPHETLHAPELAALANRGTLDGLSLHVVHTRSPQAQPRDVTAPPVSGEHGHFRPQHLERLAPWHRQAQTYLCGPEGLLQAVSRYYDSIGCSEQLHTERFTAATVPVAAETATGTVRFARSGVEVNNSGRPLLEQAEAAGLSPEHGCRMGICMSCTQRKTTGRVRNAQTNDPSQESDEEIQLCISVPEGDVTLDC